MSLSPALRQVADFIDQNRFDVMTRSAVDLAATIGTSDATVVRAVQALGFDGLADLRRELTAYYGGADAPVDNLRRTLADVGTGAESAMDSVAEELMRSIASLRAAPARGRITDALKLLHVAERIVVFGIGPTAHIAAYFASRVRRKGRRQLLLDRTGSSLADQLLELGKGDVVLMLAYGRSYPEAEATIAEARRLRLPIVLISDSLDEALSRHARVIVPVARGQSKRVSLHGATLACLEMLLLGLATSDHLNAVASLQLLSRLRDGIAASRSRKKPAAGEAELDGFSKDIEP